LLFILACEDDDDKIIISPDLPVSVIESAWSPDGTRLAVATRPSERRANGGLYIIDTATWTTEPLVTSSQPIRTGVPRWSPDGHWIVFTYNASLYRVRPNGDSLTRLTYGKEIYYSDWSWSDTLIAYKQLTGDSAGIWLMTPDGSIIRSVIRVGDVPTFGPDDSLYYSRPQGARESAIYARSLTAGENRTVYSGKGLYQDLSLQRGGDMIALAIDDNVWTMKTDGTEVKRLTYDGGTDPDWRPDGGRIVYTKPTTEGGSLWLMDPDGSDRTPVPGWE
jgi:Tol biopolymer transport system component